MVSKASSFRHAHQGGVDRIVESRIGVMVPLKCVPPCNDQDVDLVRCETTSVKKCAGMT